MSYSSSSTNPEAIPISPRNRRSSIFDAGGPNSINQFASSYSRMQSLTQNIILPPEESPMLLARSPSLVGSPLDENNNIRHYGAISDDSASVVNNIFSNYSNNSSGALLNNSPTGEQNSVFNDTSYLAPSDYEDQFVGRNRLYSVNSRLTATKGTDDATVVAALAGKSTSPQTIFNSINILIGVGLYSLSFGFRYSGLVYGVLLLILCGVVTDYSAVLIGRCLKAHNNLFSYGDLALYCYGTFAFFFVVLSFSLDLIGAAVALVLLFSDSFHTFFPEVSRFTFQVIFCFVILSLSLLPLNILSNLSFVGIVCTSGTVVVCIIAGFSKSSGIGSLFSLPPGFNLWPQEYKLLLVSLGIFLALFGGHAVFPELYHDMRHPQKFSKSITVAFTFTIGLDLIAALVGYVMFGSEVDEILTNSIMKTEGYPSWIPATLCLFLGLVPLTKGPLVIRPVATVLDQYFKVHNEPSSYHPIKILNKAIVIFAAFIIANVCSSFAQVMAVLGSLICFTICITLPFMFYYKLFYNKLSKFERLFFEISIFVSVVLTTAGTYAAIVY